MDLVDRIKGFHRGRSAEGLRKKYAAMRQSALRFLRASNFLFFEDETYNPQLNNTPATWICGDLHIENFGTYKGDNRLVYFDINDFDDCSLAPASWDLTRFLTSLQAAAAAWGLHKQDIRLLQKDYLEAYYLAIKDGKARWLERNLASGIIKDLFDTVRRRTRVQLLKERTTIKKNKRALIVDGKRAMPVTFAVRAKILEAMTDFAVQQAKPKFFKVLDVAGRLSGTASLGLERYVLLVEGRGSPDGDFLLDIKEARPSPLTRFAPLVQPSWTAAAERVITVQKWMQAISPAFLHTLLIERKSFIFKELQESADRLNLADLHAKEGRLTTVVPAMGKLTAWAHLRGAGHSGAALPDDWAVFSNAKAWRKPILQAARERSAAMEKYYRLFCEAYDDGAFEAKASSRKGRRSSSIRKTQ
jgi:uncharacterized protein (DUF2252 family)